MQVYIQCTASCSFEADVNIGENGGAAVLRSDTETSVKVIHVYIDHKLYVVYDCLMFMRDKFGLDVFNTYVLKLLRCR